MTVDLDQLSEFVESSIDLEAKKWMNERIEQECERLKQNNIRAIPLSLLNVGLYHQQGSKRGKSADQSVIVNRVEVNTNFDFDKIQELMVSPPQQYPGKPDYLYVNVLLWTDKPLPLILPYLYDSRYGSVDNTLAEWNFINASGKSTRHRIKNFHSP